VFKPAKPLITVDMAALEKRLNRRPAQIRTDLMQAPSPRRAQQEVSYFLHYSSTRREMTYLSIDRSQWLRGRERARFGHVCAPLI
jgi:hypothetical protein